MLLANLKDLNQLRELPLSELENLAADIRETLIHEVAITGGHLGPNLGVVELSIALHRVLDSPTDRIVFDTGHQTYVHKLLTGRFDSFNTLRQLAGLSGYPSRAESAHDIVENSHASTSLAWADGIADALRLADSDAHVVGVIGDGALTGGMAWEALNNIAGKTERPLIIVLNDNGRSYAPTIGGIAQHLTNIRTSSTTSENIAGENVFESLGLAYIGPVDGHDIAKLEQAFVEAKLHPGPVVVHCITQKGFGYTHAENDLADHFHGIPPIDAATGLPSKPATNTWTQAFSQSIVEIGRERSDVVAITAAMMGPTGLNGFAVEFPDRIFDVGIAEQHAATAAAGMALAGLHPVVALYATFINRAFDQVLMDCALHKAGVTFVLDRAGVTGDDGASHNGIWDLALLSIIPGVQIFAPRDVDTLEAALKRAVNVDDGPSIVRFSKGSVPSQISAVRHINDLDVLVDNDVCEVFLVGIGALAELTVEIAHSLNGAGIASIAVNPTQVFPVSAGLADFAMKAKLVVTIEDGLSRGGFGDALSADLRDRDIFVPVKTFGVRDGFPRHAPRNVLLNEAGLDSESIVEAIKTSLAKGWILTDQAIDVFS